MQNVSRRAISSPSAQFLSSIYSQLARLESAGLPVQQALNLLRAPDKKTQNRVVRMRSLAESGKSVVEAGVSSGVFSVRDQDLLIAGEIGGNLEAIYTQLSQHYAEYDKRRKKIKTKLIPAFIVLIVAFWVQPLPAFVLGEISLADYLLAGLGKLLVVIFTVVTTVKLPFWLTTGNLSFLGFSKLVYRLQLSLPVISAWHTRRQTHAFLNTLGLMLDAGVPITEAMPRTVNVISNPLLKKRFIATIAAIDQGCDLTTSLRQTGLFDNKTIQFVRSGEQSGKLAESLLHYCRIERETISLQEDMLTEWVPRIVYLTVAAWVAGSMI